MQLGQRGAATRSAELLEDGREDLLDGGQAADAVLAAGDVVEVEVSGVGVLRNPVVDEQAA